jgi:methylphosphotriester-DNA--protein-cysteine methyltransferase
MTGGSIPASIIGIYCRPVCPVRPARSANVSFFPSAVAAEAASARACVAGPKPLHFAAPGSAARPTVEPGLRLIVDERALDRCTAGAEGQNHPSLTARIGPTRKCRPPARRVRLLR